MATFYGPATANPFTHPITGDMRKNYQTGLMEVFTGSSWTPITPGPETKETLADSVLHAVDTIGSYIEEDHRDNITITDAYAEWLRATERFRVIVAMAEK